MGDTNQKGNSSETLSLLDEERFPNIVVNIEGTVIATWGSDTYQIRRRFDKTFERITSLVGREGENAGNILLLPVAQDVLNRNRAIIETEGY